MTTNLTMSADAKQESDQEWARWIAAGAKRNRAREKRAQWFAIAIACVLVLWLIKLVVLG